MNYPLQLSFKMISVGPQISVTDASGNLVMYVKQKAFKLKEAVTIFADQAQTMPIYTINADRVIDFSAAYHIADTRGQAIGAVKRQGMKSIWRAEYHISDGGGPTMIVREENPWRKVLDGVTREIPIVGMFAGYIFCPSYIVTGASDSPVMRLAKQPSFFDTSFKIDALTALDAPTEARVLTSLLMIVLLERHRE
jgi:hypothetical protein